MVFFHFKHTLQRIYFYTEFFSYICTQPVPGLVATMTTHRVSIVMHVLSFKIIVHSNFIFFCLHVYQLLNDNYKGTSTLPPLSLPLSPSPPHPPWLLIFFTSMVSYLFGHTLQSLIYFDAKFLFIFCTQAIHGGVGVSMGEGMPHQVSIVMHVL